MKVLSNKVLVKEHYRNARGYGNRPRPTPMLDRLKEENLKQGEYIMELLAEIDRLKGKRKRRRKKHGKRAS